jgi:FHS family L-fucose permease-like MFS transporter
MGQADGAAFRLNLLQGCNSAGTIAAPLFGAAFLTRGGGSEGQPPFVFALLILIVLTILYARSRRLLDTAPAATATIGRFNLKMVIKDRKLVWGMAAIFAYVGAEVSIGALLTNYLMQPAALGVPLVTAARLLTLYWAGAMVGRFAGSIVMRRAFPATPLLIVALVAAALTAIGASATGLLGSVCLIAVGLCNSIMYPTIYVLALPAQTERATSAATLLCMAVVGGAVVPMLCGQIADRSGLGPSLFVPVVCYLVVATFALYCSGRIFKRA